MGNKRNVLWNPCVGHTSGQKATEVEIPQVREMPQVREVLSGALPQILLQNNLGVILIAQELFRIISTCEQALRLPSSELQGSISANSLCLHQESKTR